jgi:hypothetical protein
LPVWVALIEQVPAATNVTVLPETVQIEVVVDAKLTGSPEEAVALTVTVPADNGVFGIVVKVMV